MENIEGDDHRHPDDPDVTAAEPAPAEPVEREPAGEALGDGEPGDDEFTDSALAEAIALAAARPEPEIDEIPLDLQPVLALAAWAYGEHEPSESQGTCPVCGTEGCDPYRWADRILEAVAVLPVVVVKQPD